MRSAPRLGPSGLLVILALVAAPFPASAQTLEGPLTIRNGAIGLVQLATGRDGDVMQLCIPDGGIAATRRFPNALPGTDTAVTIGTDILARGLTALPHGGYAAVGNAFEEQPSGAQFRVVAMRLSPAGIPTGPPIPTNDFSFVTDGAGVAPAGDGFVVAFHDLIQILGQRYDATGTPVGGRFVIAPQAFGFPEVRVVPVAGDRFLVVWGSIFDTNARLYEADANAVGPAFPVATSFRFTGLAVNPAGTLAALVGVPLEDDPNPNEIRIRFFAPDGSFVGDDEVVGPLGHDPAPDVACDPAGNFLVASGSSMRVRAYDGTGTALGPMVALGFDTTIGRANVIGRRDGGFFLLRTTNSNKTYIARVTLCTPGSAVCGDGTLVSTCEVCDAGGANSDSTPDACRTDCRPSRCGDGTTDSGEQCDDGNGDNCDGCDELCELEVGTVCGDGVVAPPGCHEACDDGDTTAGDGCSATCKVEHIFGGGKLDTDCFAAWRIDNPSNDPRLDKRGGVNPKQRCRDNDPACDFDGGLVGSCTFHLAVCANNSEPIGCFPSRLKSWTVTSPNAKQAAARPALAAVRAVLDAAVLPSIVGSSYPDDCSPAADVVVPLRGTPGAFKTSKLRLKTRAEIYNGAVDSDGLLLRCDP